MSKLLFSLLVISNRGLADLPSGDSLKGDNVVPRVTGEKSQFLPKDKVLPHIDFSETNVKEAAIKAREKMQELLNDVSVEQVTPIPQVILAEEIAEEPQIKPVKAQPVSQAIRVQRPVFHELKRSSPQVFKRNIKYLGKVKGLPMVSIPSGSKAKATLEAGLDVADSPRKMDVKINYAFLGPNETVIDMTGCHVWINFLPSRYNERLCGEPYKIVCRAHNGMVFSAPIRGVVADAEDEYKCLKAKFQPNGKLAAAGMQFLADGTKMYGEALAAAQVEQSSGSSVYGDSTKISNVDGNKNRYIAGKTIQGASGKFLNWWVDYYTSLASSLSVAPGKTLYVKIESTVNIPKIFFQNRTRGPNTKAYGGSKKNEKDADSDLLHQVRLTRNR